MVLVVLAHHSSDRIDLPFFQPKRGKWEDVGLFIAAVMLSCWHLPAVPPGSSIFLARTCVPSYSVTFLLILSVCKKLIKSQ